MKAEPSTEVCKKEIAASVSKFSAWLAREGYASYDPYDVWGTNYGLWARKTYYERGIIGLPFIAPIIFIEYLFPSARKALVKKERFATADGQLVLAFLNLFAVSKEKDWLDKAEKLASEMIEYSVPGFSGLCWGYPFNWQHCGGLSPKGRPFITSTPYGFEAFMHLHAATDNPEYLEKAASVAKFVHLDLKDKDMGNGATAGSYSPFDDSDVINASAYRAYVLVEAARRFDKPELEAVALRNIRYILRTQREDGAWLYSIGNPAEAFIDHFHTCFVIKNLVKVNRYLESAEIEKAIVKGYDFYRKQLFYDDGLPKSFSIEPRKQIVRLEMYNMAEAITLGVLLKSRIPAAYDHAKWLGRRLATDYQVANGHFVTRVYRGGLRHTFPFLRWPQAQLFYAQTNLLRALHEESGDADLHGELAQAVAK
jgi:hypothetical protein